MADKTDVSTHKIMTMGGEKRQRVISAAMIEFCKGFKNASTDVMVAEAGISKGLLYHYFGTKRDLYDFLIHYAFDVMRKEYFDLIDANDEDLLEHLHLMINLKFKLSYRYPAMFEFITAVYTRPKDFPPDEMTAKLAEIQREITPRIFSQRDGALFKDGIDPKKAINIIYWTIQGYSESNLSPDKKLEDYQNEYEKYLSEITVYFDIFRKCFYK